MSEIPFSRFKRYGQPVTPGAFDRLVDLIQSITLNSGANYLIRRNVAGTTLITKGGGSAGAAAASCPFDVKIGSISDGSGTGTFTPGTVNQLLPTGIFDSFTFDATTFVYVKITVVTDGTNVTSCSTAVDTTAPTAQTPTANSLPTEFTITIGVIVNGVFFRTLPCGSVTMQGFQQFITDKETPGLPGQLNYIPYFVWVPASSS